MTTLAVPLVLFASFTAWTQSSARQGKVEPDSLLARVSYSVGGEDASNWQSQDYLPSCFALYRSGYYQISRTTRGVLPVHGEPTIRREQAILQGTLSPPQLEEFRRMLKNLDFKSKGLNG
jgi:hypothetical protein